MRYRMMLFPEGKRKAFTMSYDDDCPENRRLVAKMNQYGLKGTFNLNSRFFGNGALEAKEICDLFRGHEIAVHGATHCAPGLVTPKDFIRDVSVCREELETITGTIIRGMAYPDTGITLFRDGITYEDTRRRLSDLGIVYSRTLGGDNDDFALPSDFYAWMPTAHHSNRRLFEYFDKFLAFDGKSGYVVHRDAKLFYLWGHAYEFERQNTWDRLDRICETVAGRPDIWYATNMEIYDYITAFRSLVFSYNNRLVYNPTYTDVWFYTEEERDYCIPAGKTVVLD